MYISIYVYTDLSVCLSVCLPVRPSVCLSASFERVLCIRCFFSFLVSIYLLFYFLPFLLFSTIGFQTVTIRGHEDQW